MQSLHLSEPGLQASCFFEKSVKGFCLWQALHRTRDPWSFSTQDMQRSIPARRRSWFIPKDEVGLSWQQATQRTWPSPAAGATRAGGAAAAPFPLRQTWHICLPGLASWLREKSVTGFSWWHPAHMMLDMLDRWGPPAVEE